MSDRCHYDKLAVCGAYDPSPKTNAYSLEYSQDGKTGLVEYTVSDTSLTFTFTSQAANVSTE